MERLVGKGCCEVLKRWRERCRGGGGERWGEEEGQMGSREEEVRQDGCGFVGAFFSEMV